MGVCAGEAAERGGGEWPAAVPRLSGRRAGRPHSSGPACCRLPRWCHRAALRFSTRRGLAAAALGGGSAETRPPRRAWIWTRPSREVRCRARCDQAASGAEGVSRGKAPTTQSGQSLSLGTCLGWGWGVWAVEEGWQLRVGRAGWRAGLGSWGPGVTRGELVWLPGLCARA